MPHKALCKNVGCPSKGACYRFVSTPTDPELYGAFTVPPGKDRCEYFIPNKMEGK